MKLFPTMATWRIFSKLVKRRDKILDRLITEGELAHHACTHRDGVFTYITGENYVKWISKCILFLEKTYPRRTLTMSFIRTSTCAVGTYGGEDRFGTMMGILKGIKEFERECENR